MTNRELLYFDYQASSPIDLRVFQAMQPYWDESFGNPHSAEHVAGWRADRAVEDAKEALGALIGADADEVIFTSGATEANNLALFGLARGHVDRTKRRRILVSTIEHKCVLAAARALYEHYGFEVDTIPVDSSGHINIEALVELASDDVLVCSIILVNNEIGTIQKLSNIKKACAASGIILHCDAAQAPAAMDLSDIVYQVDFLSLSGHKMYGPMGIGALYIRRDLQCEIEPMIYGGGQQNNLRSGTLPLPLCVGMGAAAKLCTGKEAANERERVRTLRDRFVEGLIELAPFAKLNGSPLNERHPGNANFRFEGFDAQDLLGALQPRLAASSGSACTSGIPEPSHVLRAIGLTQDQADASIRFSIGHQTTDEDIEAAIVIIVSALAGMNHSFETKFG